MCVLVVHLLYKSENKMCVTAHIMTHVLPYTNEKNIDEHTVSSKHEYEMRSKAKNTNTTHQVSFNIFNHSHYILLHIGEKIRRIPGNGDLYSKLGTKTEHSASSQVS
jgi:hypothetical protein